ncbi:MAG: hypothetical protein GEU79_10025 [Acidimicrobiia bacterium]|nr:hypothetical protein [Acidimicrobiia bacterium]
MAAPTRDQVQELAMQVLDELGVEVTITDEGLESEEGVFGLGPLRARLGDYGEEDWVGLVRAHFEGLLRVEVVVPESYDEARTRLRSAVISEHAMGMFDGALMERPLVDGLGERLMLRHGSMGMTVTEDVASSWGVEMEQVWKEARERSIWDESVIRDVYMKEGLTFTAIRGGIWTSSRVLDLDRFIDPRIDYGVLTVVAARDEVLFHQIRDDRFAEAAVAMIEFAGLGFDETPFPVGCDLHWWFGDRLHRVGAPSHDGYRYLQVAEFSETLTRLERDLTDERS